MKGHLASSKTLHALLLGYCLSRHRAGALWTFAMAIRPSKDFVDPARDGHFELSQMLLCDLLTGLALALGADQPDEPRQEAIG